MKIHEENCIGCALCEPYCPMGAIKVKHGKAEIDQDECVECGVCARSGPCKFDSFYQPKLEWPRTLRAEFSDPEVPHSTTGGYGRGTEEMKTNDVTGRYPIGIVGFGIELGRPGTGTTFAEVEKLTQGIAGMVEFEPNNPVTFLINPKTGQIKDPQVRKEKVMSAIVEANVPESEAVEFYKKIIEISKNLNTVFSFDIINHCVDGEIPVKKLFDKAGIPVRINGKTCMGLGRPYKP